MAGVWLNTLRLEEENDILEHTILGSDDLKFCVYTTMPRL